MHPKRDPADPEEWLRRARSNLARAKLDPPPPGVLLEDLCFDAEQAAEKAVKAVLVKQQVRFPKTHSLSDLLGRVQGAGIRVPEQLLEAATLTEYAVDARYPGLSEDVTPEEYEEAVLLAERVVSWAEQLVRSGNSGPAE